MKKLLLLLLVSVAIVNFLHADPVDELLAGKIAKNFYMQSLKNQGSSSVNLTLAFSVKTTSSSFIKSAGVPEIPVYYVFNVNQNEGFVIIAADNEVMPVLGYSNRGNYPAGNVPQALQKLLEKYKQEILYVVSNDLQADDEIKASWENLEYGYQQDKVMDVKAVGPLMSTTWNQSPYENEMCPADPAGPGGHCVTGCPATAMAQIMKYWNYPTTGTGFHSYNSTYGTLSADFSNTTYNWSAMPNHLYSSNNPVAQIMAHCGVAVEMNYGPGGSYGWVITNDDQGYHPVCSESAYKAYFGYAASMHGSVRASHTDAAWKQMLVTDLDAGRPIQYAGFGPGGGHTWVCDGYNADYFHMNWGWGGAGDGFFTLNALNPGSNSFNNNQQALFGIQPGQSANTTLQLYSVCTVTPNPVTFGQGFSVNADILNSGSSTFQGDYTAALFNSQGTFIDFVQTYTGESLPAGYHYTGGLTFTTSGIEGATPGNYTVGIYSRPTGGNWTIVAAGSYTNPVNVTVQGTANDIRLYDNIVVNHTPVYVNQAFTATTDIGNFGSADFSGDLSIDLHSSDGKWIQAIEERTNLSLQAGYFFDNITFSTNGLNVAPGTYYLVAWDRPAGGEWAIVSAGLYTNPIEILITGQPLTADSFEPNNSEGAADLMPINFVGNTANSNTNGSNIHIGSDEDFYRFDFPAGYGYTVNARVHDSYNSSNGQSYTGDVMFAYKNGANWSDTYDDVMPADIILPNGGTLIFNVSPYYIGATGTYLLDLNIVKGAAGVEFSEDNSNLLVYPNPARDLVTFRFDLVHPEILTGTLYNVFGVKVMEVINGSYTSGLQTIGIDVSLLPAGCYTWQINSNSGQATGKLVIAR